MFIVSAILAELVGLHIGNSSLRFCAAAALGRLDWITMRVSLMKGRLTLSTYAAEISKAFEISYLSGQRRPYIGML